MNTPLSNTGVNNGGPSGARRLTRDEQLVLEGGKVKLLCAERQQVGPSGVIVDYLRITVRRAALLGCVEAAESARVADDEALTRWLAFRVAQLLGFVLGQPRKGRDFYAHTWTVENQFGREVASVSGGGESQRETFCVTVKGEGCTFAAKGWEQSVYDFFQPLEPRITRIDLARDFLAGELSMEEVEGCYFSGAFDYRNRRPSYTRHGSGDSHDKTVGHSRTFQVGQRESGKLLRAYEKGHQFRMMDDPWLRVEVEFRNVNRIIPFEALIRPADFFSGAYEFCQMVLDEKPVPERIATGKAVGERTVARFSRWFENVVAPSIRAIHASLPDGEWADFLTIKHAGRRIPRGLAGLDHAQVVQGLRQWATNLRGCVPAASPLS